MQPGWFASQPRKAARSLGVRGTMEAELHEENPYEGTLKMSRKDALLRLHERLISKRKVLRHKLADDFDLDTAESLGDVSDAANEGIQKDLSTQLAALETREL